MPLLLSKRDTSTLIRSVCLKPMREDDPFLGIDFDVVLDVGPAKDGAVGSYKQSPAGSPARVLAISSGGTRCGG